MTAHRFAAHQHLEPLLARHPLADLGEAGTRPWRRAAPAASGRSCITVAAPISETSSSRSHSGSQIRRPSEASSWPRRAAGQVVVRLAGADHRPLDVAHRLPPPEPLGLRAARRRPPRRRRGAPPARRRPATGRSSLPNRHERMQSQPMSSAGSPEWQSSQSITAARPGSSTMRLPSRKSPWTRHSRSGGGGRVEPQPAQARPRRPAAARRSRRARRLPQLAGRERRVAARARRRHRCPRPSIEWIRASASPSWAGSARAGRR